MNNETRLETAGTAPERTGITQRHAEVAARKTATYRNPWHRPGIGRREQVTPRPDGVRKPDGEGAGPGDDPGSAPSSTPQDFVYLSVQKSEEPMNHNKQPAGQRSSSADSRLPSLSGGASVAHHTPGPWPEPNPAIFALDTQPSDLPAATLSLPDYLRARACVNACEGYTNEELTEHSYGDALMHYRAEASRMQAQRDDLAAALRAVLEKGRMGCNCGRPATCYICGGFAALSRSAP